MNDEQLAYLEEKWLNGTITDAERKIYSEWYNAQQNLEVEVPSAIGNSREEHHAKMFQSIEQGLANDGFSTLIKSTPRRIGKRLYYVSAAAAAILLFVVGYYMFVGTKVTKQEKSTLADVNPGKPGMLLTLSDGKKILLDTVKDGLISEKSGVRIIKENGTIRYEGKSTEKLFNTATTTTGRRYQIQLADGSTIWLNAGSELKYPLSFDSSIRSVAMTGEAYFNVQHKADKTPFQISVEGITVKVLGTKFDINAYKNEPYISTTLISGSVAIQSENKQTLLKPNQKAIKSRSTNKLEIVDMEAAQSKSWVEDKFTFDNMKLDEIMRSLTRWYGVTIVYEDGVNKNLTFSGSTPMNQNLSEVLKVLSLGGINCELHDNTLLVKK